MGTLLAGCSHTLHYFFCFLTLASGCCAACSQDAQDPIVLLWCALPPGLLHALRLCWQAGCPVAAIAALLQPFPLLSAWHHSSAARSIRLQRTPSLFHRATSWRVARA